MKTVAITFPREHGNGPYHYLLVARGESWQIVDKMLKGVDYFEVSLSRILRRCYLVQEFCPALPLEGLGQIKEFEEVFFSSNVTGAPRASFLLL
jgi:hypothetical protein